MQQSMLAWPIGKGSFEVIPFSMHPNIRVFLLPSLLLAKPSPLGTLGSYKGMVDRYVEGFEGTDRYIAMRESVIHVKT